MEHQSNENQMQLVRISEVSKLTGLSHSTIRRYTAQEKFPQGRKLSPRLTVWKKGDILAWLEKGFENG